MALRDLDINVEINSFDSELKTANEQCDELVNNVGEAGESLDEMSTQGQMAGETTSESMEGATESTNGLIGALGEAGVQFDALAAASGLFLKRAIEASAEYESAVGTLRVIAGDEDYKAYLETIREEVERTHRFLTEGQMADMLAPVAASMRGHAKEMAELIKMVDDRLLEMNATGTVAERVYQNVMAAITTGSATQLMRASRLMPLAVLQSEKSIEIAKNISASLPPATNAMYLFKAMEADAAMTNKQMEFTLGLTENRIYRLKQSFGDFLEAVGAPYLKYVGQASSGTQRFLDSLTDNGWGPGIGRLTGIASVMATIVGLSKGLPFILGKIGIEVTSGGIAAGIATFASWLAVIAAVALGLEDIWAAAEGRPSFLKYHWDNTVSLLRQLPGAVNRYVVAPFMEVFGVMIPNLLTSLGHRFVEFFTVTIYNGIADLWNGILKIPGVGWLLGKIGAKPMERHEYTPLSADQLKSDIDLWPERTRAGFETQVIPEPNGGYTIWRNLPTSQPAKTEVTGKTAEVISRINDQLNDILFNQEQEAQKPLPAMDLGQSFSDVHELNLEPAQSSFSPPVGHTFSINVNEGAIQVTGGDPEATAEAIKEKLKNDIMIELESDLAGNLDKPVR